MNKQNKHKCNFNRFYPSKIQERTVDHKSWSRTAFRLTAIVEIKLILCIKLLYIEELNSALFNEYKLTLCAAWKFKTIWFDLIWFGTQKHRNCIDEHI